MRLACTTELTTAGTDLLLGLLAFGCAIFLARSDQSLKSRTWAATFGLLGLASLTGAFLHAFRWTHLLKLMIWQPLLIILSLNVSYLTSAFLIDHVGESRTRELLPHLLAGALLLYTITIILPGSFCFVLGAQGICMLYGLYVYSRSSLPGAHLIWSGILTGIIAAMIQLKHDLRVTIIWPFDHNGIFHLIEIVALLLMTAGVRRSLPKYKKPSQAVAQEG